MSQWKTCSKIIKICRIAGTDGRTFRRQKAKGESLLSLQKPFHGVVIEVLPQEVQGGLMSCFRCCEPLLQRNHNLSSIPRSRLRLNCSDELHSYSFVPMGVTMPPELLDCSCRFRPGREEAEIVPFPVVVRSGLVHAIFDAADIPHRVVR